LTQKELRILLGQLQQIEAKTGGRIPVREMFRPFVRGTEEPRHPQTS